jgi:hypothetical protein
MVMTLAHTNDLTYFDFSEIADLIVSFKFDLIERQQPTAGYLILRNQSFIQIVTLSILSHDIEVDIILGPIICLLVAQSY